MPHTLSTLIIGYGNALRGDDGAGFLVAELLREKIHDPEIEIVSEQQLLPELMLPISRAAHVIFIDASVSGRAGKVHKIPLRPAPACSRFTHHVTPESLLAGAQALYGHTPEATLYSIPGRFFETGQELTPSVRRAVNELVAALEKELAVGRAIGLCRLSITGNSAKHDRPQEAGVCPTITASGAGRSRPE